ncbi:fluoride efflux transporter CrcB [Methanococcoides alaskense]|uniref:fluoride efflux transporter CrcB n=1 Tax=Methanococcoides alaskense TaxID=325778 RepID=UPI0022DE8D2C|nr:fluoride efflux transporter CrcB [Methanococcoides alaskense]MDA0525018.1 fluoride efflux transporter CrcB [Methanococcoides alaskense]
MKAPKQLIELSGIASGGFLGAISRYLITSTTVSPTGTLFVNVLGSLFLGMLMYDNEYIGYVDQRTRLIIGTGFLGSFTTFSTFAVQTYSLGGNPAIANILANMILTILAVFAGRGIIIQISRRRS